MNNKGVAVADILIFIASAFIITLVLAFFYYSFGKVNNVMINIGGGNNSLGVNISEISYSTFNQVYLGMANLKSLAFIMIISYIITILISGFLVRSHPAFFGIFIFSSLIAIVFSVYISNAYEGLLNQNILEGTLLEFGASTFILLHLPSITAIISIFSGIILFANILRDDSIGGGF